MLCVDDAGVYKNLTKGLMSDALCDEVDLSQFCQHVRLIILLRNSAPAVVVVGVVAMAAIILV